mmetsp:Transcript_63104/g.188067  ORF Transcript_63104/g.188067 Transcript_63104/m.188067 type:complete len:244 (+) Transcript_63104:737-1468(+)
MAPPMYSRPLMASLSTRAWRRLRNSSENTFCRRWTCCSPSPCCFTSLLTRESPRSMVVNRSAHNCSISLLTRASPKSMAVSRSAHSCSIFRAVVASTSACAVASTCWNAVSRLVTRSVSSSNRWGARSCNFVRRPSMSPLSEATVVWASLRCSSSAFTNAKRSATSPRSCLSVAGTSSAATAACNSDPEAQVSSLVPALSLCQATNMLLTVLQASARASAIAWLVMLRSNSSPSFRPRTCARS